LSQQQGRADVLDVIHEHVVDVVIDDDEGLCYVRAFFALRNKHRRILPLYKCGLDALYITQLQQG
jgi:hypothetical protein